MCSSDLVGTDKIHFVAHHPLVAHPDVGLDVLHDVADVKIAVGIGQGGGDEEFAWHGAMSFQEISLILVAVPHDLVEPDRSDALPCLLLSFVLFFNCPAPRFQLCR